MRNNQSGRSMIEMLGVLAIIGVLSVGGLDMITKSRKANKIAELMGGIANLGSTIVQQRKFAAEIDTSYGGNYTLFLKQTGKIPAGFDSDFKIGTGVTVTANKDANGIVVITVSGLDRETCIKVMSNNWGTRSSSRFVGLMTGSADFSCVASGSCTSGDTSAFSGTLGYPMTVANAANACSSATSNNVYLGYKL